MEPGKKRTAWTVIMAAVIIALGIGSLILLQRSQLIKEHELGDENEIELPVYQDEPDQSYEPARGMRS